MPIEYNENLFFLVSSETGKAGSVAEIVSGRGARADLFWDLLARLFLKN